MIAAAARLVAAALLLCSAPASRQQPCATRRYLGPLVCSDSSCPSAANSGGRTPNNTNFHLRDIMITAGPDGYYYLTGEMMHGILSVGCLGS